MLKTEKNIVLTSSFDGYIFHRNTQAGPKWCNTFKFTRETKWQRKTGKISTLLVLANVILHLNSTLRRGSERGLRIGQNFNCKLRNDAFVYDSGDLQVLLVAEIWAKI